jgi:hypothetical protein
MMFLDRSCSGTPSSTAQGVFMDRILMKFIFVAAALGLISALPRRPRQPPAPVPTPFCDKYLAPNLLPDGKWKGPDGTKHRIMP